MYNVVDSIHSVYLTPKTLFRCLAGEEVTVGRLGGQIITMLPTFLVTWVFKKMPAQHGT